MNTKLGNGKLTIALEGRIDSNNASQFEKDLFAALDAAPDAPPVLDAEKLEYISSAGLRVLMKLRKRVNAPVRMDNVSREVYEILEVTGFAELFTVKKALREISVEGCDLIGSGGYGSVYRIDPETIAKIYNPGLPLSFVEKEREVSQKAFLLGVPTAISYDVIRCGESYGTVYELLDAKTVTEVISEDPGRIPEMGQRMGKLLKELHQIPVQPDSAFPDRKAKLLDWLRKTVSAYLTPDELDRISAFTEQIPNRNTFLHGDFHAKNIMVRDGEFSLIDIGDAAYGHPVFDLAEMMFVYLILSATQVRTVEEREKIIGFKLEYAKPLWGAICGAYFGTGDMNEIGKITQTLMPYCNLLSAFQSLTAAGSDERVVRAIVDRSLREWMLPAIARSQPLDW